MEDCNPDIPSSLVMFFLVSIVGIRPGDISANVWWIYSALAIRQVHMQQNMSSYFFCTTLIQIRVLMKTSDCNV